MKIAVASGKGGTGKTTVATALALSLAGAADLGPPLFLDCDVEAPNAHIFLAPEFERSRDVALMIPEVDESLCTYCGICAQVCQYHAIAVVGQSVLVFPELCHGCGSCTLNCPEGAIREVPDVMGVLEAGKASLGIEFARGVMNIGEPMAVPIVRELKKWAAPAGDRIVVIDAPPGASCPVVESVRGADFLLLVTEPTPFGLHDLRQAYQIGRELGIPVGVIVNRDGTGYTGVDDFCREHKIPILMRIPLDREIAEGIARGRPLIEIKPEYGDKFRALYGDIVRIVAQEARS